MFVGNCLQMVPQQLRKGSRTSRTRMTTLLAGDKKKEEAGRKRQRKEARARENYPREAAEKGDHREKVVGKISNKLKKLLIIKNKKVSRELSQLKLSLKTNLIDFGFLKKNMLAIFPVYF